MALHVIGSARKGDQTKHFDWEFRQGLIYEDCQVDGESGIELASEQSKTLEIVVSGSVLFERAVDDRALRFDAFAEADDVHGDGDGNVTLEEMAEFMVDPTEALGQAGPSMSPGEIHSLADLVYRALVPQVARYRGDGTCHLAQAFHEAEPGESRRGD